MYLQKAEKCNNVNVSSKAEKLFKKLVFCWRLEGQ
jgi:hypothetical protein